MVCTEFALALACSGSLLCHKIVNKVRAANINIELLAWNALTLTTSLAQSTKHSPRGSGSVHARCLARRLLLVTTTT